jgi:hypothetical protein
MIRPTRWGGCFNLLAMVAEFESDLIRLRTWEGSIMFTVMRANHHRAALKDPPLTMLIKPETKIVLDTDDELTTGETVIVKVRELRQTCDDGRSPEREERPSGDRPGLVGVLILPPFTRGLRGRAGRSTTARPARARRRRGRAGCRRRRISGPRRRRMLRAAPVRGRW